MEEEQLDDLEDLDDLQDNEENNDNEDEDDDEDDDDDDDDEYEEMEELSLSFIPILAPFENNNNTKKRHTFNTVADALNHDRNVHDFDLLSFLPECTHDEFFERSIICINQCRQFVARRAAATNSNNIPSIGKQLTEYMNQMQKKQQEEENNDMEEYYKPVLDNDALLMSLDDLAELKKLHNEKAKSNVHKESGTLDSETKNSSKSTEIILHQKISMLEMELAKAKEFISLLAIEDDNTQKKKPHQSKQDNQTYYYSSYSHSSIHETMLRDTVRTNAYQTAILSNAKSLFQNKIVLDVGCGTGILSLFAVKAGARKVIALDGSDILLDAKQIVQANENDLGRDKIVCVHATVEQFLAGSQSSSSLLSSVLEPNEKVDIILSEWMGYALFFESMLPSVLLARDKLMKQPQTNHNNNNNNNNNNNSENVFSGGTMYPNVSSLFIEGASDHRLKYWNNVFGFNMSTMKRRVIRDLSKDATVELVNASNIMTNRVRLASFDLNQCQTSDLDFEVSFELQPSKKNRSSGDDSVVVEIHKLVLSFDIQFDLPGTNAVSFSTSCQTEPTHWKQTSLWLCNNDDNDEDACLKLEMNQVVRGTFSMMRNQMNPREIDIHVLWHVHNKDDGNDMTTSMKKGVIRSKLSA